MNYIWDVLLHAGAQGMGKEQIRFIPARTASPYAEVALVLLNQLDLREDHEVEINALMRHDAILGPLIDINLKECPQLRRMLFDVILHYLAILDLRQGYSKNEYSNRFILYNIRDGVYGEKFSKDLQAFTKEEVLAILSSLQILYKSGTSVFLFEKIIHVIFPDSIVYKNNDRFRELLIYIGKKKNTAEEKKLNILLDLFLPLDYAMHLFWDHHFGIIGVEETLLLGDMEIF